MWSVVAVGAAATLRRCRNVRTRAGILGAVLVPPTPDPRGAIQRVTAAYGPSPGRRQCGQQRARRFAGRRAGGARGAGDRLRAPAAVDRAYDFTASGARFLPVPRRSDPAAVAALRAACTGADVVHAHGLHAAARTALALSGRTVPLVTTWHTRRYAEGARRQILHLLERRAARAAAVVLAPSSDLVDRARERGARDARLAPTAAPPARPYGAVDAGKARAELGAVERPLLVAAGSLCTASRVRHPVGRGPCLAAGLDPYRCSSSPGGARPGGPAATDQGRELPSRSLGSREGVGSWSPPLISPCCRAGGRAARCAGAGGAAVRGAAAWPPRSVVCRTGRRSR